MGKSNIIIMLKDENGAIEKELFTIPVKKNGELLQSVFAAQIEGKNIIKITLTTPDDAGDDDFDAIFDSYDVDVYKNAALERFVSAREVEGLYNPAWEVLLLQSDDQIDVEDDVAAVLAVHAKELAEVYEILAENQ
jgi:hypothetical protein